MLRKWLIGVLFVSFWTLLATNAQAYLGLAWWNVTKSSICVSSDWTGAGNVTKTATVIHVALSDLTVQVYGINPVYYPGGEGLPFSGNDATVEGLEQLTGNLIKNGTAFSEICFSNEVLYDAIADFMPSLPGGDNTQWSYLMCGTLPCMDFLAFTVDLQGFVNADGDLTTGIDGAEKLVTEMIGQCTLNADMTTYDCYTEDYSVYKK